MHIRKYLAALEFVNQERASRGLQPIERLEAGVPADPERCSIARSIPGVSVTDTLFDSTRGERELPAEVVEFVHAFDAEGRLPRRADVDPADLVKGGVDDDKGCLVPA